MKRISCLVFAIWILSLGICYASYAPLYDATGMKGFIAEFNRAAKEQGHMKLRLTAARVIESDNKMTLLEGMLTPSLFPMSILVDTSAATQNGNIWMVCFGRQKTTNQEVTLTLGDAIYCTLKGCSHFDSDTIINSMLLPILNRQEDSISIYSEEAGRNFIIEIEKKDDINEVIKIWAEYPE